MIPSKAEQSKISQIAQISKFFEKKRIEQLANKTKFVQRKSELTGLDFFLLCVFAHQGDHQISLDGLSNELLKEGKKISKQGLQERFNDNAVCFMKEVMHTILYKRVSINPIVKHRIFKRIVIWDSTAFQLPDEYSIKYKGCGGGGSNAGVKLQYCYDLLSESIVVILVQSGACGDNNQELGSIEEGDLRIEDLGYFKLNRFQGIERAGGFYLSRLRFSVNVYLLKEGYYQEIDLLKLQRKMKQGDRRVLEVFIGKEQKLATRLIIEKVPTKISNEKRRRLKKQKPIKRKKISQERLELCNVNIFITNTTEKEIPAKEVGKYYSLRWQIEIVFKAWKSIYQIDKIKNMKLQRFECIHYGTLILIIITTDLLAYCKRNIFLQHKLELSEFKLFKTIKALIIALKQALIGPKIKLLEFLNLLQEMAYRTCIKHRKKSKITPFQIILA